MHKWYGNPKWGKKFPFTKNNGFETKKTERKSHHHHNLLLRYSESLLATVRLSCEIFILNLPTSATLWSNVSDWDLLWLCLCLCDDSKQLAKKHNFANPIIVVENFQCSRGLSCPPLFWDDDSNHFVGEVGIHLEIWHSGTWPDFSQVNQGCPPKTISVKISKDVWQLF